MERLGKVWELRAQPEKKPKFLEMFVEYVRAKYGVRETEEMEVYVSKRGSEPIPSTAAEGKEYERVMMQSVGFRYGYSERFNALFVRMEPEEDVSMGMVIEEYIENEVQRRMRDEREQQGRI